MTASSVHTDGSNMDLTCDESMPTDRDLDPTGRLRRVVIPNNFPTPQPNFPGININQTADNLLTNLNLLHLANQPSTSQLIAQYQLQLKLAQAVQLTQNVNANFLLQPQPPNLFSNLGVAPTSNPLLFSPTPYRPPPIIVNGSANFAQSLLPQQNFDLSTLTQPRVDALALYQQLALQASLPNFQTQTNQTMIQQPPPPQPPSLPPISGISLNFLQNAEFQQQQQRQQLLEQTTALLAARQVLPLSTIPPIIQAQPTPVPSQEVQFMATPMRTPSVASVPVPIVVSEIPTSSVIVESTPQPRPSSSLTEPPPTATTTEPVELVSEPIPEPEPPKKPRSPKKQDEYCIPVDLKSYLCGLDPELTYEFQDWPDEEPTFCQKRRVFFFNIPENLENLCKRETGIIHLLRKGYRFRTRSNQPFKRELKLAVQHFIHCHRGITAIEYTSGKNHNCLEILLRSQREEDLLKIKKDKRMTETLQKLDQGSSAASTQEYINQDASEGSGGTLESDGLTLAAVVDAVSMPMKRKNIEQMDLCEPSTSYAIQPTRTEVSALNNEASTNLQTIRVNNEYTEEESNLVTKNSSIQSGKRMVVDIPDGNIGKEQGPDIIQIDETRIQIDPEDILLLTNFHDNCNEFDAKEIERRSSQVQKGLLDLAKMIIISKKSNSSENDTNDDVRNFLPEAVPLSTMGEDRQSKFVYEIPEKLDIEKSAWTFDTYDRQIGTVPNDQVTVIKSLPLPFRSQSKKKQFSELENFIESHDQFMQFLVVELLKDTKDFTEFSKKNHYLKQRPNYDTLQPLCMKQSNPKKKFTVSSVLRRVQKQLTQQTDLPYNVLDWIEEDMNDMKKVFKQESDPLAFATAIQSYYTLVSFYHFFPNAFKNYKPLLQEYKSKKCGNDFIENMRKWSNIKEKVLILAKKYDEKTKGQCKLQTCIEKAIEKLIEKDPEVNQVIETSTTNQANQEIDEFVDEFEHIQIPTTMENILNEDEETVIDPKESRMQAFKERQKYIKDYSEREPIYKTMDYLGKNRFKSHLVNDIRFTIDHDGSIIGAGKSHIQNYPGQKAFFSPKQDRIAFPNPAKTVKCDDPYFSLGNERIDMTEMKPGTSQWKIYKKWDRIERFLYDSFENDTKHINAIRDLWKLNNEANCKEYEENIKKLYGKCIDTEKTSEADKQLIEMLLIFKASNWIIDDEDEDEEEEEEEEECLAYPDTTPERRMLDTIYDKTEDWVDTIQYGEDGDRIETFPELYGIAQFRNFYRTPEMEKIIKSGPMALRLQIPDDDDDYFYHYDKKKNDNNDDNDVDDEEEEDRNEEINEAEEIINNANGDNDDEVSEIDNDVFNEDYLESEEDEEEVQKSIETDNDDVDSEYSDFDDSDNDNDDDYLEMKDPDEFDAGANLGSANDLEDTPIQITKLQALIHGRTAKMLKTIESSNMKKSRAAEVINSYIDATEHLTKPLPSKLEHVFDDPRNMLLTEAVFVNRGFVTSRHVCSSSQSNDNNEINDESIEDISPDLVKKNGLQVIEKIQKDFGLKDVYDKELQKKFHWYHINGDENDNAAVIIGELYNDPPIEPVEEDELLEHRGKSFEAELSDVLYQSYIETNRSIYLIEQFERIHQRVQSHFTRKHCRDVIVYDFLKSQNRRTMLEDVETEDEIDEEVEADEGNINFNVGISKSKQRECLVTFGFWSRRERRAVKAARKLRKIISRIATVSSILKAKTPKDIKTRRKLLRRRKSVFASIRALERRRLRQRAKILNAPKLMPFDKQIGEKIKNLIKIRQMQIRLAKRMRKLKKRKLPPILTDEETSDADYVVDDEDIEHSTVQKLVYINEHRFPNTVSNASNQQTPEIFKEYDNEARQGSPHPIDTLKAILETGMNKKYLKCSAKKQQEKKIRLLKKNLTERIQNSKSTKLPSSGDFEMPIGMSAALMLPVETMIKNTTTKSQFINFDQEEIEKEIENKRTKILEKSISNVDETITSKIVKSMFDLQKIAPIRNGKPLEPSPGYKAVLEKSARRKAKMFGFKTSRGIQTGDNAIVVEPVIMPLNLPSRDEIQIQEKARKVADKMKKKIGLRRLKLQKDGKRKYQAKTNLQICQEKIRQNLQNHRHLHSVAHLMSKENERDIYTPPSPIPLSPASAVVPEEITTAQNADKWLGPLNYGDVLSRATSIEPDEILPRIEKIMSSCPYKVNQLQKQKDLEDLPLYDYVERRPEPVKVKKKPGRKPKLANHHIENGTVNGTDGVHLENQNNIEVIQKPRRGRPRKHPPNTAIPRIINPNANKDGKVENENDNEEAKEKEVVATKGKQGRKKPIPVAVGLEAEFDTNEDSVSPELEVFVSHDSRRENAPSPEIAEGSSMTVEEEGHVRKAIKYHMYGVESEAETEEDSDDENRTRDDSKNQLETSHESDNSKSKKKRARHRYDKKVNWSRKKKNKMMSTKASVSPEAPVEPEPTEPTELSVSVLVEPGASEPPSDKPKRKQRMRHKWADTPSRTPSPRPPSPPLPPKRTRKQAKPIEIIYDSPRKRKKNVEAQAENTENPVVVQKVEINVEQNLEKSDDELENTMSNTEDKSATDDSSFSSTGSKKISTKKKTERQAKKLLPKQPTKSSSRISTKRKTSYSPEPVMPKKGKSVTKK